MKKLMTNKIGQFIVLAIAGIILWPLLDMAYTGLLTHHMIHYTLARHVLAPVIFSAIFTLIDAICFGIDKEYT